jgi:hypothetical protein
MLNVNSGLTVSLKIREFFFDRLTVAAKIDKQRSAFLNRVGGFVRRVARNSLRRRKKPSEPGSPPSVHSKDDFATLKNILYGFNPATGGVDVGPVGLNQKFSGLTVPEIHEYGATVNVTEKTRKGENNWRRVDKRRGIRPWEVTRVRRATYPPRPTMARAVKLAKEKFPQIWYGTAGASEAA